jgi:hypothetical protein
MTPSAEQRIIVEYKDYLNFSGCKYKDRLLSGFLPFITPDDALQIIASAMERGW